MGFWDWLGTTGFDLTSVISGSGLLAVATMSLTDRIVPKSRLLRDLSTQKAFYESLLKQTTDSHAAILAAQGQRYDDVVAARDTFKAAVDVERARGDQLQDQLGEANETARAMLHVIQSMDEALTGEPEQTR